MYVTSVSRWQKCDWYHHLMQISFTDFQVTYLSNICQPMLRKYSMEIAAKTLIDKTNDRIGNQLRCNCTLLTIILCTGNVLESIKHKVIWIGLNFKFFSTIHRKLNSCVSVYASICLCVCVIIHPVYIRLSCVFVCLCILSVYPSFFKEFLENV